MYAFVYCGIKIYSNS